MLRRLEAVPLRAVLLFFAVALAFFAYAVRVRAQSTDTPGAAAVEGAPVYTGTDFTFGGILYCQGEYRTSVGVGDYCLGGRDPNHFDCVWNTPAFDYRYWSKPKSAGCSTSTGWTANTSSEMLPHYVTIVD